MKVYTIDEVQDKIIGKIGTSERDRFEYEIRMDMSGKTNKQTRIEYMQFRKELTEIKKANKSCFDKNTRSAVGISFRLRRASR